MTPIERPLAIAAAGTHSTGKSTFLSRIAHELRRAGFEVATVTDLGERALQIGLPILHSHNYASTLWIMAKGISSEVATWPHVDVLLVDRPVPDALGYLLAALEYRGEQLDPDALDRLRSLAAGHSVHYDLIFRTTLDPSAPLGTNKARDNDIRYRALADKHVAAVLADLNIPHRLLSLDEHGAGIDYACEFALNRLSGAPADATSAGP